jgi:hypothetical protein
MRPMLSPSTSANHRLPSGPAAMLSGRLPAVMPALYSVTTPRGVIRPIRSACSVNHRLPSGPAAMRSGPALAVMPALNSVTTPAGVMRPTRPPKNSVNQRLPSDPAVMPLVPATLAVMPALNSVTTPSGVMRPILFAAASVNHRLPSGPAVMSEGEAPGVHLCLRDTGKPRGPTQSDAGDVRQESRGASRGSGISLTMRHDGPPGGDGTFWAPVVTRSWQKLTAEVGSSGLFEGGSVMQQLICRGFAADLPSAKLQGERPPWVGEGVLGRRHFTTFGPLFQRHGQDLWIGVPR